MTRNQNQKREGWKLGEPARLPWAWLTSLFMLIAWVALSTPFGQGGHPLISSLKLPGPLAVLRAAIDLNWVLVNSVLLTLSRVVAGMVLGSGTGVVLGLAMAHSNRLAQILDPLIEGARPVPALAVFPLLILWLGIGFGAQLVVVGLGVFVVIVVGVYESARRIDKRYLRFSRSLGADALTIQTMTILPMIMPALVGILRIASATAFTTTIGAEFLGAQGGLGFLIRNARITLNTEAILLGVITIGLLSWLVDKGIRGFGAKATRWVDQEDTPTSDWR
jgi:sulfonate transport system permease protein